METSNKSKKKLYSYLSSIFSTTLNLYRIVAEVAARWKTHCFKIGKETSEEELNSAIFGRNSSSLISFMLTINLQ